MSRNFKQDPDSGKFVSTKPKPPKINVWDVIMHLQYEIEALMYVLESKKVSTREENDDMVKRVSKYYQTHEHRFKQWLPRK